MKPVLELVLIFLGAISMAYKIHCNRKANSHKKLTWRDTFLMGRESLNANSIKYFFPLKLKPNKPYIDKKTRISANIALSIGYICLLFLIILEFI